MALLDCTNERLTFSSRVPKMPASTNLYHLHRLAVKMRFLSTLLVIAMAMFISAAPLEGSSVTNTSIAVPTIASITGDTRFTSPGAADVTKSSPRFSCGQYKLAPGGIVQEFYSQIWAGLPADVPLCRFLKFEFGDRKGQMGNIIAAKVDYGCTCFFYEYVHKSDVFLCIS
jgi:hypothetical protein